MNVRPVFLAGNAGGAETDRLGGTIQLYSVVGCRSQTRDATISNVQMTASPPNPAPENHASGRIISLGLAVSFACAGLLSSQDFFGNC